MVYLLFKKSEGVPKESVESPEPDAPESSPSLGHRVTLFTTNHTENGTASADPTRIVLPVSLGHPAGTGTATRKWQQRKAVNIAFDLPDLGGSASGAKIPPGPIRDFWAASTPTAEHLHIARDQQRMGGLFSRSGRKRMERNIGSYITPENVHEKLSGAVDAVKDENSAIQRVGMACYEDLSNEHNFCHRRIIAKGLSDKLGVPIPDIFHIRELQKETNNTDQPLKYFEDTILHPMRAIAERQGFDLSKDKDALRGIFQKEIPSFDRLNQIIAHWDSQKEEPLISATVPGAPSTSPENENQGQIPVGLPDTTDRMDVNGVHTYGAYQATSGTWKPIFSNFSNISIPFKISSLKKDGTRQETTAYGKSVETIYQAAKLLKDQNGNITPLGVRIIEGKIKGLPGTETMGENPTSKDVKDFVKNLQGKNPELFDPEFHGKKIDIMRRVLAMKARYSKEFREQLVATGTADIVESTGLRNDIFWGASNVGRRDGLQSGQNVLGKLLMELRNQLISQMQQDTQSQSQETTPQTSLQTPEDHLVDLKTHLRNKNSIHSKLYGTAQLAGDGTTVLLPKQALQQFTNREGQNFSRLISTPEGVFVELKGISGKTKEVSERERETLNNQADGRNFYTRSAPHGTRSTVVFYQNSQSRDGFKSGFWYAPAGDYFAER